MTGRARKARSFEIPCTIDIEHTHDAFHAHVELEGDFEIRAGDKVRVHGAPIRIGFGDRLHERRRATIEPAGPLLRLWTHIAARFSLTELYEVSFSPTRTL